MGTNPICISAPCAGGAPVCLDMATSAVPWNVVMNARRENRPMDASLAYDATGQATTDPNAVACLKPMAGHKGYGLAMMIDLLCGPLNGAPWGPNIPAMYGDLSQRRLLGSFVGAIDPKRFAGGNPLPKRCATWPSALAVRSRPIRPSLSWLPVTTIMPMKKTGKRRVFRSSEVCGRKSQSGAGNSA